MGTDWIAEANGIRSEIKDEGVAGQVFLETKGSYNVTTGKKASTILDVNKFDIYCLISKFEQPDNKNILITDLNLMVVVASGEDPLFHTKKNLKLSIDGVDEYAVLDVTPIMPAGIPILYLFHCRS